MKIKLVKSLSQYASMEYCINFLSVNDADSILISYKRDKSSERKIILVDAGNIGDSLTIKKYIYTKYKTYKIDLAVCTHPDIDHKGGFFGLLEDEDITIGEFWLKFPEAALDIDDFEEDSITRIDLFNLSKALYSHPSEDKNLIDILFRKHIKCKHVNEGYEFEDAPIKVLGPSNGFYREYAKALLADFSGNSGIEPKTGKYVDIVDESLNSITGALNNPKVDTSSNACSIILAFTPRPGKIYLLTGDASVESMQELVDNHGKDIRGAILKVPHHGSINNLTTPIIDAIKPSKAVISCQESDVHPDKYVVRYLQNFCDVYTTDTNRNYGITNTLSGPSMIIPFRKKITK